MKLYNSLTRKIEEFKPINPPKVGMYTCGPTVYDYPTIGNYRTYTLADFLLRALEFSGYEVNYVMNLTDVGHLTGDNLGDADTGEDRLEKAAKREGKTAWDVAKFYSDDFLESLEKLNLVKPEVIAKATDHIDEQIELVKRLEEKGLIYKIDDGIYFDIQKYEELGHDYSQLTTLDKIKEGARVEPNPQKKDPRDFALWKLSLKDANRDMEWDSPWGIGFPGWHLECSAMSMKYLGEAFDIHVGGEDLRSTHHPNEIAQSEGATGKHFVNYWVHVSFLTIDDGRMGKSLGNAYTLQDIQKKGFTPLDLRYFYLTGHYRKQLNFTWEAFEAAKIALAKLRSQMASFKEAHERTVLSGEKMAKIKEFQEEFKKALENDLNMPQALAVAWEVVKSNIPDYDKYDLLISFDEVLGLKLSQVSSHEYQVSPETQELLDEREQLRKEKKFSEADAIRDKLKAEFDYEVRDKPV
jgi:cysteinyl-tRNA synthetase